MNELQSKRLDLLNRAEGLYAKVQSDPERKDLQVRDELDRTLTEIEALDRQIAASNPDADAIRRAVQIAQLPGAFADGLLGRGVSLEEARSEIFTSMANRSASYNVQNQIPYGQESEHSMVRHMAEALSARFGGPAPSDRAREYVHMRAIDMARACVEATGVSTRTLSPSAIITRALHGMGDFTALLTETGNRTLRAGYASYQGGLIRICRESSAPDFRAKSLLQLSEAPTLVKVTEHGEVTRGTMTEAKTSYSLATYARIFGLSRQAIINDDLGAFVTLNAKMGRSCAEFVASQLVTLLTSNPTMAYDSVVLFHSSHANLGTAAVISVTSLAEALKLMRKQTGLDGATPIDVTPKYLVVPAALEVVARQNTYAINATKASDVNPFTADLEVVVDPRLDAASATAWYLAANPSVIDTIEYSYLEGTPGPQIESRAGFDIEGMEVKIRLDFGAGVLDHRGLVKNAGA